MVEAQGRLEARARRNPTVDPDITVREYAERWLALSAASKPRTIEAYRVKLRLHLFPTLGGMQLRKIQRSTVRTLIMDKLNSKLAPATVRLILATLRSMLSSAVADDLLVGNPAAGMAKSLGLQAGPIEAENVKALDAGQLQAFLAAARSRTPEMYPLWHLMSRTGLRLGEALGLQWDDVDFGAGRHGEIRVARALSPKALAGSPKARRSRTVDLSRSAAAELQAHHGGALEDGLWAGQGPRWLFPQADGGPLRQKLAYNAFKRVLRPAGLPGHFSPHSLRHTYASILLAAGAPIAYVQEQLGHARPEMTVMVYGRWVRKTAEDGTLDALDGDAEALRAAVGADQIPKRDRVQGRQNPLGGDEAGSSPAAGSGRVGVGRQGRPGRSGGGEAGHFEGSDERRGVEGHARLAGKRHTLAQSKRASSANQRRVPVAGADSVQLPVRIRGQKEATIAGIKPGRRSSEPSPEGGDARARDLSTGPNLPQRESGPRAEEGARGLVVSVDRQSLVAKSRLLVAGAFAACSEAHEKIKGSEAERKRAGQTCGSAHPPDTPELPESPSTSLDVTPPDGEEGES